ncbi:PadR family transcriptional regulator [Amycolatopsis minnesotensis]|uniref:PadR family transcriptional regulator n=1 Tax=Amycolatopsis minnesotensis TaxID=337894 RepID=A0ABP5E0Q5_9PSEU
MSATRLLVLGVVRMHGSAHGYQVRRELLTWSADKWANVKPGSIYHALKKMAAQGLLAEVAVEPGDAGPERLAYRLTDDGETEFQVLLTRALSDPRDPGPELGAGMTFLTTLPRQRAIGLLRHHLAHAEAELHGANLIGAGPDISPKPAHVRELYDLWRMHAETGVRWTRTVIEHLEAGEYVMADDADSAFGLPPQ